MAVDELLDRSRKNTDEIAKIVRRWPPVELRGSRI